MTSKLWRDRAEKSKKRSAGYVYSRKTTARSVHLPSARAEDDEVFCANIFSRAE